MSSATTTTTANLLASDQLAIHQLAQLNAVYFVNSDLDDLATLLAGVPQGAQVVLLDPTQDGLTQKLTALQGRTGLDAIHIIGHGSSGLIDLGSTRVTTQTLTERAQDLATLGGALSASGDILLYGCDVAAGADGLAFVNALADATGADVAASTDLTGAAVKGGDWVLEAQTGQIDAGTIQNESYQDTLAATPRTYTVTQLSWQTGITSYYAVYHAPGSRVDLPRREIGVDMLNIPTGVKLVAQAAGESSSFTGGAYFTIYSGGLELPIIQDQGPYDQKSSTTGYMYVYFGVEVNWNTYTGGDLRFDTHFDWDDDGSVNYDSQSGLDDVTINFVPYDDPTTWTTSLSTQTWASAGDGLYGLTGAVDPDNTVTYSYIGGTKPSWITVAPGGQVYGNPAPQYANQSYSLTVGATGSTTVEKTFTIQTGNAAQLNDVPTASGATQSVAEDGSKTFAAGNFNFADLDNSAGGSSAAGAALHGVRIDSLPAHGTFKLNGVAVTTNQYIETALLGTLVYTPDANYNGSANFSYSVFDSYAFSASATMALTVNSVPDTPSITGAQARLNTQSTDGLVISRNVADGAEVTHFKITGITNGTLFQNNGTTPILNGAFITYAQGAAGLKFTPTTGSVAPGNVTIQASNSNIDAGLGGSTVSATILVNYPPTSTDDSATTLEDTTIVLTSTDFGTYADADTPADPFISVKITTMPLTGTLEYDTTGSGNWTAVTLDQVITVAHLDTNRLRFTPGTDLNGAAQVSLGFRVNDGNSFSVNPYTLSFDVTSVSDAPAGTDATLTLNEDATHVLTVANFGFTDPKDATSGTANALTTVTITTLPTAGALTLDGVAVTAGAVVSVADITAGKLVFTPVANLSATGYASFTFQVKDDGGTNGADNTPATADDGADLDALPNTITFNVTPVNDAPVMVDGAPQLTTIDENKTTANTAGNLVSDLLAGTAGGSTAGDKTGRTDVDTLNNGGAGNTPEAVGQGIAIHTTANTGPADGGTWQYSIDGGTNWVAIGAVSSSNTLLLSATDKVRFVPDAENATSASISFYAWDEATGTHGTKVDPSARGGSTAFSTGSDTATLSVTPVNDAPTLDLDFSAGGTGYTTTFLPRGTEVAVVDADITIADLDQTQNPNTNAVHAGQDTISKAVVTLTAGADDNYAGIITDETLSFKDGGVTVASWTSPGSVALAITGNGTGTGGRTGATQVTITGVDTWANYQLALQKVLYNNANLNPTTGNRTVTVVVTDNDDTDALAAHTNKLASNTATTTITVPGIAVVDMNGNIAGSNHTVTYTEGGSGTMLATVDGRIDNLGGTNLKNVVLTLSNPVDGGAESLFVDAGTIATLASSRGITVTSSNGGYTITLAATDQVVGVTANAMNVALRTVLYKNTSDGPSATPRVVNVTVEDLNRSGLAASSTVTVLPVNDAPVISVNTGHTVLEGGLLTLGTANLNATDIDDTQSTLEFVVTTAPTKGVLFRDGNGNNQIDTGETLAAAAATGVITSFTQGDLASGLVKYRQTDTQSGPATDHASDSFAFKVQDGMENGITAPSGTASLTITAVNDAPTLTATASNPTFSETLGTAVALFSGSAASAIESAPTAQTITEIKLTVAGLGNGADEKLVADGGTAFALQAIGTTAVAGGTIGGVSYAVTMSASTATVTLTHAGLTPLQAQALVDSLTYQNTNNAPGGSTRVVTLTSVKDNGGTANGGIDTTVLSVASTITISASDSAPVLASNTGKSLANGALYTLTTSELNTTDSDTADSAILYTVGTAPTKGTLFKDLNSSGAAEAGETLAASSTFTQADLAAGLIKYRHGGVDNTADSFAFTVKDATTTLSSATFNLTISGAPSTTPGVTGTGSTTPNSSDGSDALFSGVVVSPASGNTIKSLAFTVAGVRDGASEKISVNGQSIALTAGTTTAGDITYVVTSNPNGSLTLTVTDTTNAGWSSGDASTLVNGMRYLDQQVPPSAGQRSVTLTEVTDWLAPAPGGAPGTPVTVSVPSTITLAASTDLFGLSNAQAAIPTPTAPNDVITTLNFNVTGAADGSQEVMKINGHEIAMVAGSIAVDGVTYTVADTGVGNFSVAVTKPAGWTAAQAEALLDGATYVNNASPATTGSRGVTLASVVEADLDILIGGNPTPSGIPTTISSPALVTTVVTTAPGTGSTPLSTSSLPPAAADPKTLDTLTFTVTGVKDGANEVLTVGTSPNTVNIPLVPGTVASTTPAGNYVVTVVNGTATVVFTPNPNLSVADATTLVQSVIYTDLATPPTEGTRTVALTGMGVDDAGTVTDTPVTTISGPVSVSGITLPVLSPGSGTDVFAPIDLPTPATGHSVKAFEIAITGAQDGAKETITVNGQTIPLVNGTSVTVDGITYVVVLDASGNGTLTVTDGTAPGWNEAQTENILNNIGYQNTANPPTAGNRAVSVSSVTQADNADWTSTQALAPLPGTAIPAPVAVSGAATTTPAGTSDQLFASVDLPTPTVGSTVSELSFTVTGVKNGEKEIFTVNGQNIPLVPGSTTVDGVTYTVTVNASGTATVTVTDSTVPGFTEAKAEAIVNGAAYTNTASPAIAGDRVVTLTGMKEMTAGGTQSDVPLGGAAPTPVTVNVAGTSPTVPSSASSVDLFNGVNLPDPVAPSTFKTLTFGVTGVKDGASEVFTVNGQAVPLTDGTVITVGDVTYTVTLDGSGNGTVTVTDATAPGFSQTDAQNMVNNATYANSASPATAGDRAITLQSTTVMDGSSVEGATTPVTGTTTTFNPSTGTTTTTPMASETLSVTPGRSVDSLTFTVEGVKDGGSETLTIGGQSIPLVATTTPLGPYTDPVSGKTFTVTVTVDAAGKATVVVDTPDAPTLNFTDADAQSLVQGVVYSNSATPPTAGTRNVALASMVEETGTGEPAGTPSTVPQVGIGSPVVLPGAPSADVFTNTQTIPALGGGETVDSFTIGVAGVKDGANEIININGQAVPLAAGTITDPNGYTYTVAVDANGNATVTVGTPAPATSNFTQAQVNVIIDGISYTNKASPVTPGARDISINGLVKEDGSAPPVQTTVPTPGLNSSLALGAVTNTGPVVGTNTTVDVVEGRTVTLTSSHLAASDAQQAAGSLVFKFVSLPSHGTVFRDANGNGLVEAAEAIAVGGTFTQQELTSGTIKYRHNSSETAGDVLQFTVSDGIATTTAMPLVFAVSRVNDMPTLTATAASPAYIEATPTVPVALYSAATAPVASTGDTLGAVQKFTTLTLTISNIADGASEMLLVNGTNQIELSGNTAPGNVGQINTTNLSYTVSKSGNTATVTLTHTGLTAAELQTLVSGLKYQNTSPNPTAGARAINITQLKDDGGGALPNLDTAYLSLGSTVTVASSNDTPALQTGTAAQTQAVTEGGAFNLNTTHLAATDADSPSSSFSYKVTSAQTAGLLYIDNNSNAVNDAGDTTLAPNSTFTQAELASGKVRYQHDGNETGDSLQITVSDGNSSSAPATLVVTRTPVNDAPTLASLDGDTITYPPLDPAMLIDKDSNATVTDPDSTDFNTGTLRVSVYFNGDPVHDVLSIKNVGTGAGQISVSGSNVSYANTLIGTYTGGSSGADLVVTLNASATPAATAALIQAVQFNNTQAEPALNSRGIRVTLSDGDGGTSLASQVQINIPVGGPSFLSGSGFYVSENTSLVTVMAASDALAKMPIVYSIGTSVGATNADAAKFSIDASNGTLSFLSAPDYETPSDSGGNNVYNVVVRASNRELAYTEAALAVNVVNIVTESGPAPGDTTPPVFGLATVNASTLVMTYTDAQNNLDATNVPPAGAFAVSGNTVSNAVVNATAKTVTLTLGTAVTSGQAVTVSYTDPTVNNDTAALQDAAGNDAASLASTSVSNITPSTGGGGGGGGSTGGGTTTPTTPTGGSTVSTDPTTGTTTVVNNGTTPTVVPTPPSGGTVTTTGTGPTTVTHPGTDVTINNIGTGTVTTGGITGSTTINTTGGGSQTVDLSGVPPGSTVTIQNTGTGTVNVSNLPDGVIVIIAGVGPVSLNDTDGASQSTENRAPAKTGGTQGDGNGDHVADALQSNVTSMPFLSSPTPISNPGNAPEVFVSLVADSRAGMIDTTDANSATLSNVQQRDRPADAPADLLMPLGMLSFTANVGSAGTTETFSLFIDPSLAVNGYWKKDLVSNTWVNLASAAYGGQIVSDVGKTRLDFQITDGGQFDSDGKADGIITDPGAVGFGVAVNTAPTLAGLPAVAQAVTVGAAAALADFTVADLEQGATGLSVTLTSNNGVINGLTDADPGTPGIQLVGTAAGINAAIAAATFTANAAGAASIIVSASDDVVTTPTTGSYSLTATAGNTAPTISGVPTTAQTVTVGTAAALADFTVADLEQGATGLSVTLTPNNGVINGLTDADPGTPGIQLVGTAAGINAAIAAATFTANAAGAASIIVSASDDVVTTPTTGSYSLTATAGNTAPTISGVLTTAQTVSVGTAAALADFMVADLEQGATGLSVTLTPNNGVINGLTDADPGTPGIQFAGTATAINTAIAAATFTASVTGSASIGISVSDGIANPVSASYTLNARLNTLPTGSVLISGTPTQGQTLTASNTLGDLDGLGSISYQWQSNGINISGATASTLLLGLDQVGKTITVQTSYTDLLGTPERVSAIATASVAPIDTDSVPDAVENAIPGLRQPGGAVLAGDGNGDGVADSLQSNVTSAAFLNTPTAVSHPAGAQPVYVTLVADSLLGKIHISDNNSASLSAVAQLDAPAQLPTGVQMPLGLLSFNAHVGLSGTSNLGITETFSLYVDASLGLNGYWKQGNTGHWVNLASSVTQEGGKTRVDFSLTDGGAFDADHSVNGVIADPGALGVGARPVFDLRDQVLALYIAYYDRAPDAGGLQYWLNQAQAGMSLNQISAGFATHPRFAQEYSGLSEAQIAARLYTNLLHREGDSGGIVYWATELKNKPLSDVVVSFVLSAMDVDLEAMLASGGLSVAEYTLAYERQKVLDNLMQASEQFLTLFGSSTTPTATSEFVAQDAAYQAAVSVLDHVDHDPNAVFNQRDQLLTLVGQADAMAQVVALLG